jgi:hypothetical protein
MTKKFKLLLLDANVVLQLFKLGRWREFIDRCDVWLAATVVQEAEFYTDDTGNSYPINLKLDITDNRVTQFAVAPSELSAFRDSFDPSYLEKLDDGETESLAFLVNSAEQYLICSADRIVYRVLGNLKRSEQGISLEEILKDIGLGVPLPRQFTKAYRKQCTGMGFEEGLGGTGRQSKNTGDK